MRYVAIRNWSEYQHYKNRRPPWVKLHVQILDDGTQRSLSVTSRLLALLLLAVAANKENHIPADPSWLSIEVGIPKRQIAKALDELLAARYLVASRGAITDASNHARPSATPRDRDRERDITAGSSTSVVDEDPAEIKNVLEAEFGRKDVA